MNDKTIISLDKMDEFIALSLKKSKVLREQEKKHYDVFEDWQLPYAKATVAIRDACEELIETIDSNPMFETLNPHYRAKIDELFQHNEEFLDNFYDLVDNKKNFPNEKQWDIDPDDFTENINADEYGGLDLYVREDECEQIELPVSVEQKIEKTVHKINESMQMLLSAAGLA